MPNLPVPTHLLHPPDSMSNKPEAKPVSLFSADTAFDSSFVLAPPAHIEAQNQVQSYYDPSRPARWNRLSHAPISVAPGTTPQRGSYVFPS